jgi:hypothetical protein
MDFATIAGTCASAARAMSLEIPGSTAKVHLQDGRETSEKKVNKQQKHSVPVEGTRNYSIVSMESFS